MLDLCDKPEVYVSEAPELNAPTELTSKAADEAASEELYRKNRDRQTQEYIRKESMRIFEREVRRMELEDLMQDPWHDE